MFYGVFFVVYIPRPFDRSRLDLFLSDLGERRLLYYNQVMMLRKPPLQGMRLIIQDISSTIIKWRSLKTNRS